MNQYLLQISAKKVQSFIFRSTKFRHILGANAIVGSLFCEEFVKLKNDISPEPSIPWDKPNQHINQKYDLPWENFQLGITASTGGHFEALFSDKEKLELFCKNAAKKAKVCAPGLMLDFFMRSIDLDARFDPSIIYDNELDHLFLEELNNLINPPTIDNPFMKLSINGEEPIPLLKNEFYDDEISYSQYMLEINYKKIRDRTSNDYLTQWLKELEKKTKLNVCADIEELYNLSNTPKSNQICMIKLDGNGTGAKFKYKQQELEQKGIANYDALWAMEEYWFNCRQHIRNRMLYAIQNAINELNMKDKNNKFSQKEKLPLILLMMGGDDILLICIPEFAYPFLKYFFDQESEITFSAGMLFFKHNYPFLHAHNITESLLSSAKIKSREYENLTSSIDWHILYSSKPEPIEKIRQSDYFLSYDTEGKTNIEILSQKPYNIQEALKVFENAEYIVKKLSQDSEAEKIGRNKYKLLRSSIYKGHQHQAHLIDLFNLKDINWLTYYKTENSQTEIYTTQMLDVIELIDLFPKYSDRGNK